MEYVSIIALDIARNTFQAHGATADGGVVFRKKRARGKVLEFLSQQPACGVALEALRFCASPGPWPLSAGRCYGVQMIRAHLTKGGNCGQTGRVWTPLRMQAFSLVRFRHVIRCGRVSGLNLRL